jgi:hypothetical protein
VASDAASVAVSDPATDTVSDAIASHHRALLLARRCNHCAERIPAGVALTGTSCPHCNDAIRWPALDDPDARIEALMTVWRRRRWWVYGLVAGASFLTGSLPLVATGITIVALLVMRHTVLRAPLAWLSPRRRVVMRLHLRQWLALVAVMALVANELLTLLPLVNMPVKMLVSLGSAALYLETSLRYVKGRLRRDQRGPELDAWEWALPLAMLVLLMAGCIAVVATFWLVFELLEQGLGWLGSLVGAG